MASKATLSTVNAQIVLSLRAPNSNSRTITFCLNIIFVSSVISPALSMHLNKISRSQTFFSFGFCGLKLNIPVIYFTTGCLFRDGKTGIWRKVANFALYIYIVCYSFIKHGTQKIQWGIYDVNDVLSRYHPLFNGTSIFLMGNFCKDSFRTIFSLELSLLPSEFLANYMCVNLMLFLEGLW